MSLCSAIHPTRLTVHGEEDYVPRRLLKYAPSPPDVPKVHPTKDFFTKISLGSGMTEIQKTLWAIPSPRWEDLPQSLVVLATECMKVTGIPKCPFWWPKMSCRSWQSDNTRRRCTRCWCIDGRWWPVGNMERAMPIIWRWQFRVRSWTLNWKLELRLDYWIFTSIGSWFPYPHTPQLAILGLRLRSRVGFTYYMLTIHFPQSERPYLQVSDRRCHRTTLKQHRIPINQKRRQLPLLTGSRCAVIFLPSFHRLPLNKSSTNKRQ